MFRTKFCCYQSFLTNSRIRLKNSVQSNKSKINASIGFVSTVTLTTLYIQHSQSNAKRVKQQNFHNDFDSFLSSFDKDVIDHHFAPIWNTARVSRCEDSNCNNEKQRKQTDLPLIPPSRLRKLLYSLRLYSLPIPRLLTPDDPVFIYPSLKKGLKKRQADEKQLALLEKEAIQAKLSGDSIAISQVIHKISELAYGKGVTPQMRQDFLIKYGCAAFTEEILSVIHKLGSEHNIRGIIEIGAGNGQWARAISDYHNKQHQQPTTEEKSLSMARGMMKPNFEFIMAYDDMSSLPLPPSIYHSKTKPAHDHFYPNVRKSSHLQALQPWESRGRVLLLVFPPPGPMALETVREYVRLDKERNDTIVYVGEGKGGANADEAFFEFFKNEGWVLTNLLEVGRDFEALNDKGFEKCFCFKRKKN